MNMMPCPACPGGGTDLVAADAWCVQNFCFTIPQCTASRSSTSGYLKCPTCKRTFCASCAAGGASVGNKRTLRCTTTMPPSKRAAPDLATDEANRYKSAMDSIADEYVCPITSELPLDPVVAEDGKIYERAAIEEYIRTRGAADLNSPMTNMPMGTRLTASTQVRNTIETLVRSGAISGDKAESWLKRLSDEEMVKTTRRKAEGGDCHAMRKLAEWYHFGKHGLAKSCRASYQWFEKGARMHDPACLASAGLALLHGGGVDKNVPQGVCFLTEAATMGSRRGAYVLGLCYEGNEGELRASIHGILPADNVLALYWYRKAVTNDHDDVSDKGVDMAKARVESLEAELAAA